MTDKPLPERCPGCGVEFRPASIARVFPHPADPNDKRRWHDCCHQHAYERHMNRRARRDIPNPHRP